jgi:hypothetical protein
MTGGRILTPNPARQNFEIFAIDDALALGIRDSKSACIEKVEHISTSAARPSM